jgi:hypothetical protein
MMNNLFGIRKVMVIDLNNLDYEKALMQRKKFRHYVNYLNLRKEISGETNMILKMVNSKNQYSPR